MHGCSPTLVRRWSPRAAGDGTSATNSVLALGEEESVKETAVNIALSVFTTDF